MLKISRKPQIGKSNRANGIWSATRNSDDSLVEARWKSAEKTNKWLRKISVIKTKEKKTFKFCNQQGDGSVSWCDIWSVRIQPVALTHHFLLLRRAPAPRTSLCGCALNQLGKVTAFTKNICLGECRYVFISNPMGSWMGAQPVGSRAAQGACCCTRTSPPRESQPGCWMLAVTKTFLHWALAVP